jgi:N-acetylmuramoyl-L-alanine amidase
MHRSTALDQRSLRVGSCVVLLVLALTAGCSGDRVPETASSSPRPKGSTAGPTPASPTSTATEVSVPRPRVVSKPIPFPDSRKQEMLAYAKRHYDLNTYRLISPLVVVEHFTASSTFGPVFNTFAADTPHLGELPGTCAHFVIDTDGTIFQLVPLTLMCRHTVGLNYTAIGIEMVGQSDQDILGSPRELTSALTLTLWLMHRFHIQLRNVIGHNESLTSPFRRELVGSLRCQTHQDWNHKDMEIFRRRLARLAARFGVPLGPAAAPVDSGC